MTNLIHSIKDLENSKWAEAVRNPETLHNLIPMTTEWIHKHANCSELVQQVNKALDILTNKELLTARNLIILAAGLLYVITPADAVPDFIPLVGFADDLGVIALVLNFILASKEK